MEKLVTLEHATEMVESIKDSHKIDHEAAHVWEDQLRWHFIEDVANGHYTMTEAMIIAKKILETEKFEFSRHCA